MTSWLPRSVVHQATFRSGAARLLRDRASAELNLPGATRHLVVDGVRGWLYPLASELMRPPRLAAFAQALGSGPGIT